MNLPKTNNLLKSAYVPKLVGRIVNTVVYISPKLGARMALNLFRYPLAGKIKPLHKEFLATAERHTLYLGNTKIQTYKWPGSGKRVLLMHGWQSNSARWSSLIPLLQKNNYEVISMDAPAHGGSGGMFFDAYKYVLALEVVVKHFEPEMIVAHSIGGLASLYYKAHFKSDSIEKIITLGAPNKLVDLTAIFIKLLGFSNRTQEAYNREFTTYYEKDQNYYKGEDFVQKINIPGVVIHDRNDKLNLYRDGVAIAENWKGSKLYTTNRLGHSLQAQEVYDIIVAELGKSQPQSDLHH